MKERLANVVFGQIHEKYCKPCSADDGPEIDLIKFFQAFPRGACAAPNLRTPLDTWRRICTLHRS